VKNKGIRKSMGLRSRQGPYEGAYMLCREFRLYPKSAGEFWRGEVA
jgi:hypothetical protein